jgi:multimeric flavodoxin WrbA
MATDRHLAKLKVLCFAGSPRRGGNTDRLLDQAVTGAISQGAQVKQIVLNDLDISPCQHCDGCIQTGGICVIEDDMQWIHSDLREYDRFIFAAPVFYMGVPAQAKAMIDRCQALWVIKHLLKLPVALYSEFERRGIFISVGGTMYNNTFQGSIATVKSWYLTLDIKYSGELIVPGIDKYGAIIKHATALKDAYTLGQALVS